MLSFIQTKIRTTTEPKATKRKQHSQPEDERNKNVYCSNVQKHKVARRVDEMPNAVKVSQTLGLGAIHLVRTQ